MIPISVKTAEDAATLNKYIDSGCDVFMLIYMVGCGPCNLTKPEWFKLKSSLGGQYKKNNKLVVADVNKDFAHLVHKIKPPNGFPTMLYVSQHGNKIENYEDSSIRDKSRNVDSFMNWIESHVSKMEVVSNLKEVHKRHSHRHKRTYKGRSRQHHLKTTGGKRSRTKRRRRY